MSCFPDFIRCGVKIGSSNPAFGVLVVLPLGVIFHQMSDLDGIAGELSAGSSLQFLLYGEGFILDTMILALFGPFNFGLVLQAGPGLNFGYSHVDGVTATAL